jgi:hypothetical protein
MTKLDNARLRKIPYSEGVFFITFTCYQWLSFIEMTNGYDLEYKWFDDLQKHLAVQPGRDASV